MNPGEATESVSATAASPYRIRGRSTPLDYLFFMRPVLMPPVWTIALLGTIGRSDNGIPAAWWALFLLQLTCLFGAVYTLNQICDIESDRLNCKLIFLPEGLISVGRARAFTAVLNLVAVGCATLFGWTYVLLSLGVVVLGAVYSVGRQPWKNHPILGLLANTIGHGTLVFLLGRAFSGTLEVVELWHSCAYFFAVGGVYLATTVPDATGDRLSGKRTVAVMIGRGPTMSLATVCVSCAIAIAVYFADTHLLAAAGISWPFFLWGSWSGVPGAIRAAKVAVLTLTLVAAWTYPLYLVLLVVGFLGTRRFFLWRFDMTYPTFT